jgi:nucleoside diphosphate kinase
MKIVKNSKRSTNKVSLVCCVHGNEVFGKDVFDNFSAKLAEYPGLTIVLANEKALSENRRFIDSDLNRVFPGDIKGDYEKRLAAQIMEAIDKDSYVIDIHTTTSPLKLTPIITNLTRGTRKILNQCDSEEVVFMKNGKNALIGQFQSGVSFEYGERYAKTNNVVPGIESMTSALLTGKVLNPRLRKLYKCSSALPKHFNVPTDSENFKVIEGTNILPFLIFEKNYTDYEGFALQSPKVIKL